MEKYPSQNDIALVMTKTNIGSDEDAKYPYMPICLAGNRLAFETGIGTVGGWGAKHANDKSQKCRTTGLGPAPFKKCRFPFKWKGREYNYCLTTVDPPATVRTFLNFFYVIKLHT